MATTMMTNGGGGSSTNVLGSQQQEAEQVGNVPFIDTTAPITTGNEIVAFSTVEAPTLESVPVRTDIDENVLGNLQEGRDHSVKDILCREYAFADFVIPVGGIAGDILQQWNLLDIFLAQPNVLDKVSGFAFMRVDLLVRLEFTTLPTVTGGVMLSFYPDIDLTQLAGRIESRLQLSQVPNIQQSLTTAVSMKMRTPWISPFYGRDLANGFGNIGTVILSRLTPSSINPVSVKAYVSAEESSLKVQYPTTGDVSVSSVVLLNDVKRRMNRLLALGITREEIEDMLPETQSKVTTNRKNESKAISSGGKISGILNLGQQVATVASGIPVIGAAASAVAPLLGLGSKIAGLFGFSKPPSDKAFRAIKWKPADSHLNNEGLTLSHEFTINHGCSVSSSDVPFGSAADEMAVEAIMRTPNIIADFNVTTALPVRHVVYQSQLNLFHVQRVGAEIARQCYMSHQAWLNHLFLQWNATLNFDFDAYITHFHRVKLRFIVLPNVYSPNYVGSLLPASIDINKASSAVVEFSGDNVNWSLQIAPRSNTSMKLTPSFNWSGSSSPSWTDYKLQDVRTSYGTLIVMIEVPLQASSNVAGNVNFVVNFSAEDVELTFPISQIQLLPSTQSAVSTLGTAFAKSSRSERMIRGADMLKSNSVAIDDRKNVEICAGDACIHLRNLLNGFYVFVPRLTVNGGTRLNMRPMFRRNMGQRADQDIDCLDYLSKGYAFFKGGVNIRLVVAPLTGADVQTGTCGTLLLSPTWNWPVGITTWPPLNSDASGVTAGIITEGGVRSIPVSMAESPIDISIPYYQPWHVSRVSQPASGTLAMYGVYLENNLVYSAYGNQYVQAYRAVGDDFRMGFLMSLPRFQLTTTLAIHA